MGSLWDEQSHQPEQPNSGEAGNETPILPLPDSGAQSGEILQGDIAEPHFLYAQPIQGALWELTIGGVVQSSSASRPSPQHRRLREQVEQRGVHALADADLIALLISAQAGNEEIATRIRTILAGRSLVELLQEDIGELQHELGPAEATQVKAVLEMARRLTAPLPERYMITSPADAAAIVMPDMAYLDHEEVRVLLLNTQNHVLANLLLYQGTLNSSVIRASELFRPAVTRKCAGIIVCHNHPSGIVESSAEDIQMTMQCVEAGKYLEIALLDHLIIGNQTFVSLKERLRW